MKESNSDIA